MSLKGKFITITGDIIEGTGLNGNELLLYSLINGFSQDEQSWFYGSISYIQKWLGTNRKNTILLLQRLVEKGFLEKKDIIDNKVKRCMYRCVYGGGVEKTLGGGVEKTLGGGVEKTPYIYNIDINNIDNIYIDDVASITEKNENPLPSSQPSSKASKKGTRISENWQIDDNCYQYALAKGLDSLEIERQSELFLNYWLSKSGASAVKKDWTRTWYTWVLNYVERYQKTPRYGKENQVVNAFEHNKRLFEERWGSDETSTYIKDMLSF